MTVNYRLMKARDISGVFSADQQCFKRNWTLDAYECEFKNMLAHYIIAEENGEIIGFGGFWAVIDEAQITNIGVLEKYRGLGIGRALLHEMTALAAEKGCVSMTLEVRADNQAAIGLYEANGFKKAGLRPKYYDNEIDGIIMWRVDLG